MVNNAADDPAGLSAGDKRISQLEELTVLDGTEMVPVIKQDEDGMEGWDNYRLSVNRQKMLLFIDQWNAAWGAYGRYDPDNAPDPEHPFMGNDIWLTYEEAIIILQNPLRYPNPNTLPKTVRTNLLVSEMDAEYNAETIDAIRLFIDFRSLEILRISCNSVYGFRPRRIIYAFYKCFKLRSIIGMIDASNISDFQSAFAMCPLLEKVTIKRLKCNISFADSPLLSLDSLSYIITYAQNTDTITVTVHPTVYAKITDETNTEWHALLDAAAAKNISFATV